MSEIPDDLLIDARALVRHLEAMPSDGNVRLAASMLLAEREAERERCAAFAYAKWDWPPRWIAAAFRGESSAYYDFVPAPVVEENIPEGVGDA